MPFNCAALLSACIVAALALPAFAADAAAAPAAAPAAPQRLHLWDKTPDVVPGKDADTDPTEPTVDIYLPDLADGKTASGVVVLPGGGYTHLSTTKEGKDVALFLNAHHIAAFVVRYRHAPRYHYPIPLEDAQRAIRLIRSNAGEYHIDPHHLGIMGFSAGGHLAALTATAPDQPATQPAPADAIDRVSARPDFAILIYPVITFTDPSVHKGSRTALAGNDEKLWQELSAENRVTKDTPPVFLVHSAVDTTVPVQNSILFFEACHKNKVPVEMHIFPAGHHGFGLAADNKTLNIWPELLIHWMTANGWS